MPISLQATALLVLDELQPRQRHLIHPELGSDSAPSIVAATAQQTGADREEEMASSALSQCDA